MEVEKSPEESKPQIFSEIGETTHEEEFAEPQPTLPTKEEERIEEVPEPRQEDFKGDEEKMEEEQKVGQFKFLSFQTIFQVHENEIPVQKESREKAEDEASLLGMASAIQAEILVEEALNRVLADGIPSPEKSPEQSQKASPEPANDDWELLEEEKEVKPAEPIAMTTMERYEVSPDFPSYGADQKLDVRTEKDSTLIPHAEISPVESHKQEEPEVSSIEGESDEEDAELVQLHIGKREEVKIYL